MIKAIKNGQIGSFSERSWALSRKGWEKCGASNLEETKKIPVEVVAFKEPVEEIEPVGETKAVTIEDMKEYLKDKGIKLHHKSGEKKIKELYYAN